MTTRSAKPTVPTSDEPIVAPANYAEAAQRLRENANKHAKNRAFPELRQNGLTKGICLQLADLLDAWQTAGPETITVAAELDGPEIAGRVLGLRESPGDALDEPAADPLAELHAAQARQAELATPRPVPLAAAPLEGFAFTFGNPGAAIMPESVTVPAPEQRSTTPSIEGDGAMVERVYIGEPLAEYRRMFGPPARPVELPELVSPHGTGIHELVEPTHYATGDTVNVGGIDFTKIGENPFPESYPTVALMADEPAANGRYAPGTDPESPKDQPA